MKKLEIPKLESFGATPKVDSLTTNHSNSTMHQTDTKHVTAPAQDQSCNNCEKGHFAEAGRQRERYKRKIRIVTENETTMIGDQTDDYKSSFYCVERLNGIVKKH